jgi:hypothetical protein
MGALIFSLLRSRLPRSPLGRAQSRPVFFPSPQPKETPVAKPDENTQNQIDKSQEQIDKLTLKLQDPNLTPEERAEIEASIANHQAKIDRLSGSQPA